MSILQEEQLASLTAPQRMRAINDHAILPVALTVSMQKPACVLLHMMAEMRLDKLKPLFVDSQFHFSGTHNILEDYERLFGISVHRLHPANEDVQNLVEEFSTIAPFNTLSGADACCNARKVQPLLRELAHGYSSRISGLMQSEGDHRHAIPLVTQDNRITPPLPVYHPLFDWSQADVDAYIELNNLPVHELYSENYASIGCFPCTTALQPGETDPRSGRWRHLRADGDDRASKTYCAINSTDIQDKGSGI